MRWEERRCKLLRESDLSALSEPASGLGLMKIRMIGGGFFGGPDKSGFLRAHEKHSISWSQFMACWCYVGRSTVALNIFGGISEEGVGPWVLSVPVENCTCYKGRRDTGTGFQEGQESSSLNECRSAATART